MSLWNADGVVAMGLRNHVSAFASRRCKSTWTVFDYGCGTTPYRANFEKCGAKYIGADIDGSPDLKIAAGTTLPVADETVDCVVSFQVLEHVRHVGAYLEEARRILRPDGTLLLSTHGVWPYHPHPDDFWRWTRTGLIEILESNGFVVSSIEAVGGPGVWMVMFPMLAIKKLSLWLSIALSPSFLLVNILAVIAEKLTPHAIRHDNAAVYVVEARRSF